MVWAVVLCDAVQLAAVWFGMVWHGTKWHDMTFVYGGYGVVTCDLARVDVGRVHEVL